MRNNIIPQIVSVQSIAFKPASREGKEKKKKKVSLKKNEKPFLNTVYE